MGVKIDRRLRLTTLPPSMSRMSEMCEPQPLANLRVSTVCTGITLPLPFTNFENTLRTSLIIIYCCGASFQ
jgi:hypothetical protein